MLAHLTCGERAALEAHRLELARNGGAAEGAAVQAVAHQLNRVGRRAVLLPQLLQAPYLCAGARDCRFGNRRSNPPAMYQPSRGSPNCELTGILANNTKWVCATGCTECTVGRLGHCLRILCER